MKLLQPDYEDEDGRRIEASKIDAIGTYVHVADGFYNWDCGACNGQNSDRWWKIAGRVVKCKHCHKLNLLVRTDCDYINEAVAKRGFYEQNNAEIERLRSLEKYNKEQLQAIKQSILSKFTQHLDKILTELG